MTRKFTYKQRIFGCFFLLFTLFSIGVVIIEQQEEQTSKREALEATLDGYAEIIHASIVQDRDSIDQTRMNNLLVTFPPNLRDDLRVTIIAQNGKVIFDDVAKEISTLENHSMRPEVQTSLYHGYGSSIRLSKSVGIEYLYYAKHYPDYYVRVALPTSFIKHKNVLKPNNIFIYLVLFMFVVSIILMNYVAGRFSKSISQLKSFAIAVKDGKQLPDDTHFPDDELGEIGNELVEIFEQLGQNKRDLESEREKLIQHFQFSEEGLCIFNSNFKKVYANTHFIQGLNLIIDRPTLDVDEVFRDKHFKPILSFLKNDTGGNRFSMHITQNSRTFFIQVVIFEDKSFELTLKDISKTEKTRLMKQEMTNNIAHELRTPVTSLRAYLETLTEKDLSDEKKTHFIDRAYKQTIRLSNLVDDVSLISKIEETSNQFKMEDVSIVQIVNEVRIDLVHKLAEKNIKLEVKIPDNLRVNGNHTLLHSIFRNLMDNSINYAGTGIKIGITNYLEDDKYLFFSYYDTGCGVEEQHLGRLFERFYRVNEGRSRDSGGSGLGLSIVKNAVLFHKGEIQVKNRIGGGLEFLFTLKK